MNEESKIKMKISELLRNPGGCIDNVRSTANMGLIMVFLTMVAVTGSGAFGFAIGSFAGWDVAAIDALKMAGVMLFSFFLCYPMLYVFACLGGCELNPFRLMAVGLVCMAILGCLLAALAPIMWLFAVSTESVGFIVFFACALTAIAVHFAQRPLPCAYERKIASSLAGLRLWFFVFFLVAFQSVTLMRPMLSPRGSDRHPPGKCFFLEHLRCSIFN